MAGPSSSTAIMRYELSLPFTEFDVLMNRKKYVGHHVFTPRPAMIQAAEIGRLKLEQLLFQQDTKRAPGGDYASGDFELDSWNYATDEYGFEECIDDRQLAIYRDLMDAETIHATRAANVVLDHYERDCASTLYDAETFTGALTYACPFGWNGPIHATPIEDIVFNAKQQFRLNCGYDPNAFLLNSYQLDQRQFGEWILYRPRGGRARQIHVIVNRQPIAPIGEAQDARAPVIEIEAADDPLTGVAGSLIDTGGDKVDVGFREGEPVTTRSITEWIKGIAGVTRFSAIPSSVG